MAGMFARDTRFADIYDALSTLQYIEPHYCSPFARAVGGYFVLF